VPVDATRAAAPADNTQSAEKIALGENLSCAVDACAGAVHLRSTPDQRKFSMSIRSSVNKSICPKSIVRPSGDMSRPSPL